jgi:hypothetical protein
VGDGEDNSTEETYDVKEESTNWSDSIDCKSVDGESNVNSGKVGNYCDKTINYQKENGENHNEVPHIVSER